MQVRGIIRANLRQEVPVAPIENDTMLRGGKKLAAVLLFCVICVALDYIGSQVAALTGLPVYFDTGGIMLAGVFGGYIPGIIVGYVSNLITSISNPESVYWCLISMLIAVFSAYLARRGWFDHLGKAVLCVLVFAFIGGGIGSLISWFLYYAFDGGTFSDFVSLVTESFLWDVVDKGVTVAFVVLVVRICPDWLLNRFDFSIWQQEPLEGEQLEAARHSPTRSLSLRAKIVAIAAIAMVVVAVFTTSVSYAMFVRAHVEVQSKLGEGVATLMADRINANRIQDYIDRGEKMPGYSETERALEEVRDQFPEVRYAYVYKIDEEGCHVAFDLDADNGVEGSEPGTLIPFDPSFEPYINDLLAGNPIEPIVSDDSYGWLLTAYQPLYDTNGVCTGYVGVDISMETLQQTGLSYLARVIMLFMAFFVLICAVVIWLAEYGIIMPVNSIARAAGNFAFDSETGRRESVEQLHALNVHTGDEVENLYQTVSEMSDETVQYISDSQEKAATIERMQNNLIMVMADLVESRDKHTGDHVRKTAAYTRVIMDEMRREGVYADILTDEYCENVVKSAPLHDIGKIEVSDTILNKPARLTDEEFAEMQNHTIVGKKILEEAVGAMSEPGYLDEAQRLAAFHHEKWNGKGYPYGLAGEDIPLSARIMAVADVFDALVSKRSYKDGMPIEKALGIIKSEAGTHFDPQVANAFLSAEAEARRIAAEHGDAHGTASDIRDAPVPKE